MIVDIDDKTIFNDQSEGEGKIIYMQYVVLITIYTCISLFKICNSTVHKTSHIIRSYPEVDMWAPVVLQEYGRLPVYLFRLLYHLLPS